MNVPTTLLCLRKIGRQRHWSLAVLFLAGLFWSSALAAQDGKAPEQPPPGREFHQDFRGGPALHPALKLVGPDAGAVAERENLGMRITLAPTRAVNHPVGIKTMFSLSGDFEITAAYELLAADRPKDGYGVGVALNIATDEERTKFAKVARAMLPKAGSVYATEYWNREIKAYKASSVPTEVKSGQ